MEYFFNTAGPTKPDLHYHLDPLHRLDWVELEHLIATQRYFVLHAPRQTGKTTTLLAMMKELLYVMDRRFDYIIPFGRYDSLSPEIHDRFDLKNHPLPRVRCFEAPKGNRP